MNNTSASDKALMNVTIQNGIIAAIINLAGLILLYLLGPIYFVPLIYTNLALLIGLSFLPAIVATYSAIQIKKLNGGYITLKALFKYMFITFVIVQTIYIVFYVVLFKFIDPEFMRQMVKLSLDKLVKMMQEKGVDADTISNMVKKQGEAFKDNFSFGKLILSWAISILRDAIIAVIIAAIIKNNPPDLPPVIQ